LKLKSAQSDYKGGQVNFVRRIEYWYFDTYTRDQGVTAAPPDQIFNRVLPPIAVDGSLFMKWLAYSKGSAYINLSNCALDNKH